MAQMQNAQSVALQLEKVRDKLPLLYERDDILLTMIQQRGDVEKVSSPQHAPPAANPSRRQSRSRQHGRRRPGPRLRHRLRRRASDAGIFPARGRNHQARRIRHRTRPRKPIENAAKREVKNAMAQFRAFLDKVMQTNGNGVLGTISSITSDHRSRMAAQFAMASRPARSFLLQPDDPGVRLHAHHQSRLGQRTARRSVQLRDSRSTRFPPAPSRTT